MSHTETSRRKVDGKTQDFVEKLITEAGNSGQQADNEMPDLSDLLEDGSVGHEILLQRSKMHWRCREVAWVRFGYKDRLADARQYPYEALFKRFKVPVGAGLRITSYRNFHERDSEFELRDYDLIVIHAEKRPAVFPYDTHEAMLEANATAQEAARNEQTQFEKFIFGDETFESLLNDEFPEDDDLKPEGAKVKEQIED